MSKASDKRDEIARSLESLKRTLKEGDRIWFTTEYAPSGMTRYVRAFLPVERGELEHLTGLIADVTGYPCKDRKGTWAIVMTGFGYSGSDYLISALMHKTGLKLSYRDF